MIPSSSECSSPLQDDPQSLDRGIRRLMLLPPHWTGSSLLLDLTTNDIFMSIMIGSLTTYVMGKIVFWLPPDYYATCFATTQNNIPVLTLGHVSGPVTF